MNSHSDNEIMFQVKDGDLDQLGQLFGRHNVKLYNFFLCMTNDRAASEDLVQEVFLRILKFRHTYKGKGSFLSWMYQVARNVAIDSYRKTRNVDPLEEKHFAIESEEPTPFDFSAHQEDIFLVRNALSKISAKHREVIFLSRFEHLPICDIAEILKCPVNTAKVRIHRAIKELSTVYFQMAGVQ